MKEPEYIDLGWGEFALSWTNLPAALLIGTPVVLIVGILFGIITP